MLLFMTELSGDDMDEEKGTEAWTNDIDRGGLWHVKDMDYTLFYLMEEEIIKHLTITSAKDLNDKTKKKVPDALFKI